MLSSISIITSVLFCALYPLCFWISAKDPLRNNFHHFHTGLPTVILGVMVALFWFQDLPQAIKLCSTLWFLILSTVTWFCWNRESPRPLLITIPCLIGLFVYVGLHLFLTGSQNPLDIFVSILGGLIFVSSLYAMNLGHWYLNVQGLDIKHLVKASHVLWFFLAVRLIYNIFFILTGQVYYQDEFISNWQFMMKMDGVFIWVAILFGTLFPFVSMFFANEVLKLKNTQSVTGILYVILCGVILGDIAYKYYLIKYGIAL